MMKIENIKLKAASGKTDNQFVGIKIVNNQIEFHYPESFDFSEDKKQFRKDLLAIIRTISLAKTKTSDFSTYNTSYEKNDVFPISSYLWIINDYLTYGHYENKEKRYSFNPKGKVNWKKTIKLDPIITGMNIVYPNVVFEYKDQIDNILSEIYLCCVKRAYDSIGWLYGLRFDSNGIDYDLLFVTNKKYYISIINSELNNTFEDSKKIRLNNMKNIITGLDQNMTNTKEIIYGVDSYDYVYERMVDQMFSNIKDISDFYPSATWDLILEKRVRDSSNLRPDTILIKDNKVYILDAKYYRYGTTFSISDVPDTTSIQKQITYGEYIKKIKKGKYDEVYNAFVMPYSKSRNINKHIFNNNIEFVGIATPKWANSTINKTRRIAGLLVDTTYLINNWIKKDKDRLNEIASIIENKIEDYGNELV